MKKIPLLVLMLIFAVMFCGCEDQNQSIQKNDVFTDAFFSNVVEICDSRYGQVSGTDMEPIISFMKSLKLSPTDEHLSNENTNGEQLYGVDAICFIKDDGSEILFLRNHATLSSSDGYSYVVEVENLDDELESIFNQALSD